MASNGDENHDQLVEQLTTGFGAMLEQVKELARRNIDLEQRLARVREEYRDATEAGDSIAHEPPVWLRTNVEGTVERTSDPKRHQSGSQSSEEHAIWYMGATGRDNALAIVSGVQAWKVLTNGKGPLWRKFNREQMGRISSKEAGRDGSQGTDPLPPGHSQEAQDNPEDVDCPFTAMAHLGEQQGDKAKPSGAQRPDINRTSPPHSMSGSAFKCPIRMLDERSPEEVAEYFETHKHEIPRSHETCVKRYQSNAQSIRQLDAKYGNFVNMLQGLGMKHQPLLPPQEDTGSAAGMDRKSVEKIQKWADNVEETPTDVQDLHRRLLPSTEDRQGHFDRPLKDIRVGESPGRPWGIPMLGAEPLRHLGESESFLAPDNGGAKIDQGPSQPQTHAKRFTNEGDGFQQKDDKPGMVFTGPVFIGYSAEQAAALIQKCGWDPNGPGK